MLLSKSYSKTKHSLKHKNIWPPPSFSIDSVDLGVGGNDLESLCLSLSGLSFFPEEAAASHAGHGALKRRGAISSALLLLIGGKSFPETF